MVENVGRYEKRRKNGSRVENKIFQRCEKCSEKTRGDRGLGRPVGKKEERFPKRQRRKLRRPGYWRKKNEEWKSNYVARRSGKKKKTHKAKTTDESDVKES